MARDVEFNVTASDKTGSALASAERNFKSTNDKIQKESKKTGEGLGSSLVEGIAKVSPKLAGAITDVVGVASKSGGPLLAAGLAVGLPFLGAALSGAIIGGVGIGGVLGGVALVSRDARVSAAGKALGKTLLGGLEDDASVFVQPVLRQVDKIEDRFEQMRPRLQNIFRNSSEFLDPLVDGALDGVDGILRGVDRLIDEGGPVIDSFGNLFAETGAAIGDAMEEISGGSEDAAKSIDSLTFTIAESIRTAGRFTRILTETYGFMHDATLETLSLGEASTSLGPVLERSADGARRLGSGTFEVASGMDEAARSTTGMTESMQAAEDALKSVYQANNNLYASTTDVAEATARASRAIRDNGKTLDVNTEKGRANRTALSNVAAALQRQYDNLVKVNGAGPKTAAVADGLRNKFISLAQKAGLSAAAARDLANRLLNIPAKREPRVKVEGVAAAKADIQAVKERMNSLRSKTVTVNVNVNASRLNKVENQLNRIRGGSALFAAGDYWSAVDTQRGGMARTGGPTPVSVTSDVAVSLDGSPFYAMSVRAARAETDRAAWRTKVGRR